MDIDIVLCWVDGSDPEWIAEKSKYTPDNSYGDVDERYRDWGLLKYWFRCIEKNAPWVRKIHFVTWGHIPDWLDVSNPRLDIVRHEDFLPDSARPCFNSSLLERYLHRIPNLAEHFIYFNDDCFLIDHVSEEYFFINGLPRDMLAFMPVVSNPSNSGMSHLMLNNSLVLSRHFDKRKSVKEHWRAFFHIGYPPLYFFYNLLELSFPKFTGLYSVHSASPLLKSTYETVWNKESAYLSSLDGNRFRADTDVNQYLFREWGKLEGKFFPANVTANSLYCEMTDDSEKILKTIRNGGKRFCRPAIKSLCINDTGLVTDYESVSKEYIDAFDTILGEPCSFEK